MDKPTVLLVDDHADSREMYAVMLQMSGFDVAEAEDGAQAVARLTTLRPSILVTDWRMSGRVPASEMCRHFRAKGVPVIVVTGVCPGSEHENIRSACGAAILTKPVNPATLVAEIRRLLDAA